MTTKQQGLKAKKIIYLQGIKEKKNCTRTKIKTLDIYIYRLHI